MKQSRNNIKIDKEPNEQVRIMRKIYNAEEIINLIK